MSSDATDRFDARSMAYVFEVYDVKYAFPTLLTVAFLSPKQEKSILNPFSAFVIFIVCSW